MVGASTVLGCGMQWKFILQVEFSLVPKLCFVFDVSFTSFLQGLAVMV